MLGERQILWDLARWKEGIFGTAVILPKFNTLPPIQSLIFPCPDPHPHPTSKCSEKAMNPSPLVEETQCDSIKTPKEPCLQGNWVLGVGGILTTAILRVWLCLRLPL